jgi:hypothetical protein
MIPSELPGPEREPAAHRPSGDDHDRSTGGDRAIAAANFAGCLAVLATVLAELDAERPRVSTGVEQAISLAAAHVQQAIELIQAVEEGHA